MPQKESCLAVAVALFLAASAFLVSDVSAQEPVVSASAASTAHFKHGPGRYPPSHKRQDCQERPGRPVHRLTVEGRVFCLRLPRLLKNPQLDVTGTKHYARTYNDTCGLYGIVYTLTSPPGFGPPPHVHYADEEWWFATNPGDKARLHAQAASAGPVKIYKAGQVPNFNMEPVKVGGADLPYGSIGYSPVGIPHTYKSVTSLKNFWAVWGFGFNMIPGVEIPLGAAGKPEENERVLQETGLLGVPSDNSNKMFDPPTFTTDSREPLALPPVRWADVQRLQDLFDKGERCYPDE
eukprot:gene9627-9787_t